MGKCRRKRNKEKKREERKSTNSFDGLHTESVITLETAEEESKPQLELRDRLYSRIGRYLSALEQCDKNQNKNSLGVESNLFHIETLGQDDFILGEPFGSFAYTARRIDGQTET